jgi:glucose-6-phosphate dehydrogenase assembly protein OpcA
VEKALSRSTIEPEKLLKELEALWTSFGQESGSVLRACTMTLIVLDEESGDPQSLGETIAAVVPDHPSRVILMKLRAAGERDLSARVFAQCWKPFGQRQQICCEQIEITASEASVADLRPVLLALAAPDLPIVLWCRAARLFRHRDFPEIGGIAGKVIVDGAGLGPPEQALTILTAWAHAPLADMAWTRLTRWRQLVAGFFDNPHYRERLPAAREARIYYSGGAVPLEARYFGAWLENCLAAAGVDIPVAYTPGDGQRLALECPGLMGETACPEAAEHDLLREELGILARDRVFENALTSAARAH